MDACTRRPPESRQLKLENVKGPARVFPSPWARFASDNEVPSGVKLGARDGVARAILALPALFREPHGCRNEQVVDRAIVAHELSGA